MPDYQLSLAIGKEGQNARLAAKLTGWRIDIRSDTAVPAAEAAGGEGAGAGDRGADGTPGRGPRGRRGAAPVAAAPLAPDDRSRR